MMRSGNKYLLPIFVVVMCVTLAAPAWGAFTVTKRLYVDGVPVGSNDATGLTYTYERITLASEGNRWAMYNCLNGALDEFAIYEGVLGPNDVNDHFKAAGISEASYTAQVVSDNPLIYLRLNDQNSLNGAPAYCDANSSVNRNGTYISVVGQAAGRFGTDKCAVFAGNVPDTNNRGCIDIFDGDGAYAHEDVSIEVWVKSVALDTDYPRLFQHNGSWLNETAYGVMTDANSTGVMQAGVIGGGDTSFFDTSVGGADINDGNWHHIVVTYDTTYIPVGYEIEVQADNPLIYFRFEQDDIGHDVNVINDGSLTVEAKYIGTNPEPRFASGKAGRGAYLNGPGSTNGIIITSPSYTPGGADLDHSYALTPGDMSIELWFRSELGTHYDSGQALDYARLYSNNGTWTEMQAARVYFKADQYGIGAGTASFGSYMWPFHPGWDPQADPNVNTGPGDYIWHHTVLTLDVNDTGGHNPDVDPPIDAKFYLDGALLSSKVFEPGADANTNGILGPEFYEFVIGAEGSSGNRYNNYFGTFDEFAIYDHVLPVDRIIVHYQEGLSSSSWTPGTCTEIYEQGWNMPGDLNGDCRVNFMDMVDMGNDWWRCNLPTDDSCEKPWQI